MIFVQVGQKGGSSGTAMPILIFLYALLSSDSEYISRLPLGLSVIKIFTFLM